MNGETTCLRGRAGWIEERGFVCSIGLHHHRSFVPFRWWFTGILHHGRADGRSPLGGYGVCAPHWRYHRVRLGASRSERAETRQSVFRGMMYMAVERVVDEAIVWSHRNCTMSPSVKCCDRVRVVVVQSTNGMGKSGTQHVRVAECASRVTNNCDTNDRWTWETERLGQNPTRPGNASPANETSLPLRRRPAPSVFASAHKEPMAMREENQRKPPKVVCQKFPSQDIPN